MASKKNPVLPKGKPRFKKIVGWLHLWLGLTTGIVVVILGITGCLFVFQKEITAMRYHQQMHVSVPVNQKQLPLSLLIANAEQALGANKKVSFITTYKNPGKAWEFGTYKISNPQAFWYLNALDYYQYALVNPYTGAITLIKDYKYDFFNLVKMIHWSLLINHPLGQQIIGWNTFVFGIMLLTGLVLWWPKNLKKSNFNKSFKINWKARFKRLNYDLHNVPGFYVLLIALVLAITGLMFTFSWVQNAVKQIADIGQPPAAAPKTVTSDTTQSHRKTGIDTGFVQAKTLFINKTRIGVRPAYNHQAAHSFAGYTSNETYYDFDELLIDQYTGNILSIQYNQQKTPGEKLIEMQYDIHVGAVLGLPGKILAFIASLIATSLPITGFLIWWGRKKKKII